MSQHGCARSRVSTPQWCKPSSLRASKVRMAAVYGAEHRLSTPITAVNVVEESTGTVLMEPAAWSLIIYLFFVSV